jgi:hypothetical protein
VEPLLSDLLITFSFQFSKLCHFASSVKPSDTPSPNPRSYLPRLVDAPHPPEEKEEKEAKFQPRYVDLPALRERGHGPRNLAWGVVTLMLALALLGLAVFFTGGRAAVSLGICLLTFSALFVMAKLHLFRQRNGGFLALSIVCLLGALVSLGERAFVAADAMIRNQTAFAFAPTGARAADSDAPLLTNSFALPAPDPKKRQVRILKDSRIVIDDKPFSIKAGDLFPYVESKGSDTTFAVRDLRLTLPSDVVEIIEPGALVRKVVSSGDPAAETKPNTPLPAKATRPPAVSDELTQVTNSAQMEAVHRYPALGVKDSRENRLFVAAVKELRDTGEDAYFANPEWPIILADDLAKREGWARDSQVVAGSPTAAGGLPAARPAVNPDELPPDDLPSVIQKR